MATKKKKKAPAQTPLQQEQGLALGDLFPKQKLSKKTIAQQIAKSGEPARLAQSGLIPGLKPPSAALEGPGGTNQGPVDPTKTKTAAPAAPAAPQPDVTTILSQAIMQALAPYSAETSALMGQYSSDMAPFTGMMAPQLAAAYNQTDPSVQSSLQGAVSGANTTAQGAPAMQVMQNLLGQMQNRALYNALPLSQVYGNQTNPLLKALINSPVLQGLSSTNSPGSTQIGPNTYSAKPTQPASGYPTSLP